MSTKAKASSAAQKAAENVANDIKKTAEKFQTAAQGSAQEAINTGQQFFQSSVASASSAYNDAWGNYQKQAEKAGKAFQQNVSEANSQVQQNVKSVLAGFTDFGKSLEKIGQAYFNLNQSIIESNISAAQSVLSSKNAAEALEIQNTAAKKSVDQFINESAKISQMGVEAANKAMQPIQACINDAVESTIKKAA